LIKIFYKNIYKNHDFIIKICKGVLCYVQHIKTKGVYGGMSWGGSGVGDLSFSFGFVLGIYYWGCARGFGRGTLYMKWGQQNQRFGTMRLRGEKDDEKIKIENNVKCDKYDNY